ncbi:radical SAM protein [Bradyrhizobium sp. HKCCYLS3077]|uniref:radical SAM protein n=1 Tax=Bradyrhizobium sp. HKCCYLS3077 TaxID=3420761 RepID=UPI003EBBB56B
MLSRLTINSTQTCNLGCKYCYAAGGDYGGPAIRISPSLAVEKLRQAAECHSIIKLVQFIGGEPLLNLSAMQAVAEEAVALYEKGVLHERPAISAITNLTILSDEHLRLFQNYQFHLVVSLDGPSLVHNELRPTKQGKGSFDDIVLNLQRIRECRIAFDIECTYTYRHLESGLSIIDILKYLNEYDPGQIDVVVVSTAPGDQLGFNEYGRWRDAVRLQLDALNFSLDELEYGRIVPYGLLIETLGQIRAPGTDNFCPAGVTNLAIASDGDLYQCNMFTNNPRYKTSIEANDEVITKSQITECRKCWARPWCRSCVGNMEIRSPGDPHPYLQHCETLRGAISIVAQRLPGALESALQTVSQTIA